jgi:hypothetical protein
MVDMKKFFVLILFFSSLVSLKAQNYDHHEFSLSYGVISPDVFYSFNSPLLNDQLPDERYVRDNYSSMGNIFLTYRFVSLNEYFMWGGTAGYGTSSADVYYMSEKKGVMDRQFITGAFEVQFRYVNNGPFQMYSGLGLGVTYGMEQFTAATDNITSGDRTMILPGYQVNLVGVRFGKRLGGFAEFGFGYKGIVNFGLSYSIYKFGHRNY